MRNILILFTTVALAAAPAVLAQSDLPVGVRATMLEQDAGDALKAGNFAEALKKLEEYRKLGVPVSPAMKYLEARAALAANDLQRSKRVFEEYLKSGGESDPNYAEAVALYRRVLQTIAAVEAKAKADAEAALAKAKASAEAALAKARADAEAAVGEAGRAAVRAAESSRQAAAVRYASAIVCEGCPELVVIGAGQYVSAIDSKNAKGRTITIPKAFAIGRTEVTFDQYEVCVAASNCSRVTGLGLRGLRPVINVSLDAVTTYLDWLSGKTGRTFRLPTEAEWEYAARAGRLENLLPVDTLAALCSDGNIADKAFGGGIPTQAVPCDDGFGSVTAPVGSFRPNAWGLHDTLGNVWEFTQDCPHWYLDDAPTDGSAWLEACESEGNVARGTAYDFAGETFQTTAGKSYSPYARVTIGKGERAPAVGFRVVMELEP